MIAASLVFLTPLGGLLALVGLLPLLALAVAHRRERRARELLGLPAPARAGNALLAAAVAASAGLLGLAASQPVLRSTTSLEVRTDAQAIFVLDVSRSMLAARSPGAATRIARARSEALRLRDALPGVPSGVATLTDRVLPDLLPVGGRTAFEQTVRRAVRVGNPPPAVDDVTATTLGAVGALGTQSFFAPAAKHRVAIVLTDGESRPFDARRTARALAHGPGVTSIFVQLWSPDERVFDANGSPEPAYHPDPASTAALAGLAAAAGGRVFRESQLGAAAAAIRTAVGRGPTRAEGVTSTTHALAPYAALVALVPVLLLVAPLGIALRRRRRSVDARLDPGRAREAEQLA